MPILSVSVNVTLSAEKNTELLKELSNVVGKLLGKPEKYMCIHINTDQSISFAGTTQPAGFAILKSIGGVGTSKQNNAISNKLFPLFKEYLGIPSDRFYIEFVNIGAADIAFDGQTFA
ncbi:hypothetical protein GCK72_010205 [Caenorhabditis remanei]|uniref:L-dopachrome isomerase n=1 Tax=Caenorhabditis remanei TaxID=31234 RepID=A0A6A5H527_CAERE|nr:hypothetical protein GCK72_010205 [Caenorhabditis remanei]KAF1761946.1 hypothetical protein GCK72_010205 [Caenorhabditis remanei]